MPTVVEPGEGSKPGSTGREPERTRSSPPRRKTTGSERSRQGQSPARRSPNRSHTPDCSRTPVRRHSPKWETTSGKGKARAHQSSPSECLMLEAAPNTSRAVSIQEPELPARSGLLEPSTGGHLAQTPTSRITLTAQTHVNRTHRAEGTRDSEEKIDPSPNVRRILTRLQHVASPGTSSSATDSTLATRRRQHRRNPGLLSSEFTYIG